MKKILELSYSHVWASSNFIAKKEIRFYLCGIFVDGENIVSTDGRAMCVCKSEIIDDQFKEDFKNGLIIPAYAVDSLVRKIGKPVGLNNDKVVNLYQLDNGYFLLSDELDAHEYFKNVDGRYPDYKRVDIEKPTKAPKSFSIIESIYLIKFNKVSQGINKIRPFIYFGEAETDRAYVDISSDIHCIVMPLRT